MSQGALNLSEHAVSELREHGWHGGPEVPMDEIAGFLNQLQLPINAFARELIATLGGLRFDLPDGGVSWFVFDPREGFFTPDYVKRVESIVKEPVTPVGAGGGYVLLVSPIGHCYLLHDEWFCLVRFETINQLLHCFFTGDRSEGQQIEFEGCV